MILNLTYKFGFNSKKIAAETYMLISKIEPSVMVYHASKKLGICLFTLEII
jgi:hypothetical protein